VWLDPTSGAISKTSLDPSYVAEASESNVCRSPPTTRSWSWGSSGSTPTTGESRLGTSGRQDEHHPPRRSPPVPGRTGARPVTYNGRGFDLPVIAARASSRAALKHTTALNIRSDSFSADDTSTCGLRGGFRGGEASPARRRGQRSALPAQARDRRTRRRSSRLRGRIDEVRNYCTACATSSDRRRFPSVSTHPRRDRSRDVSTGHGGLIGTSARMRALLRSQGLNEARPADPRG